MQQIDEPYVIQATEQHAVLMAQHLRECDKREIWAASGLLPEESLLFSLDHSEECYAALYPGNDIPILIYGMGGQQSFFDKRRQIWMLGTDQIYDVSMRFLRECRTHLQMMAAGHTVYNYVMEGNDKTLKWLHWMNFTIMKPKPHGLLQKNFHYVKRTIPCVTSLQQH